MKKIVLALMIWCGAVPAQANDAERLLGIIIGGAIVIEALKPQQVTPMPHKEYYPVYTTPVYDYDYYTVCHTQRSVYQGWVERLYFNCYGDVIRIDRLHRY
jgi:hypothetical protein